MCEWSQRKSHRPWPPPLTFFTTPAVLAVGDKFDVRPPQALRSLLDPQVVIDSYGTSVQVRVVVKAEGARACLNETLYPPPPTTTFHLHKTRPHRSSTWRTRLWKTRTTCK